MQKPSLGWQSWSPPFPSWHGFPRWDYSPFSVSSVVKDPPKPIKSNQPLRYWCSWYAYGWDTNSVKINQTLDVIKEFKLPFTHILIDDGWTTWGDWYTPTLKKFPNIISTVEQIKSKHLQAGLWFAPFLGNSKSQLFKNHPEWFIKYKGKYIQSLKTTPIWESFLPQQYLLNLELNEVRCYITNFIDLAVRKWGITLLKLDFLYAPYFDPNHNNDLVPHSQVTWLLSYIKRHYPKIKIIACGTPFDPAIGLADIIRISKDTALPPTIPNFINRFVYKKRVKMLSQKLNSLQLSQKFLHDPDVRIFALDTHSTRLIWGTIPTNIIGVGDNLTTLSRENLIKIKTWLSQ